MPMDAMLQAVIIHPVMVEVVVHQARQIVPEHAPIQVPTHRTVVIVETFVHQMLAV